jgi:hypothetical protein
MNFTASNSNSDSALILATHLKPFKMTHVQCRHPPNCVNTTVCTPFFTTTFALRRHRIPPHSALLERPRQLRHNPTQVPAPLLKGHQQLPSGAQQGVDGGAQGGEVFWVVEYVGHQYAVELHWWESGLE